MAEMNTNTAELLQQMIDIKKDTRAAIARKGVSVFGGMVTYPEAIDRIEQSISGGGEIDFTKLGWSQINSDTQNAQIAIDTNNNITYSESYLDQCDASTWTLHYPPNPSWPGEVIDYVKCRSPFSFDFRLVISPYVYNLEYDDCYAMFHTCDRLQYVPDLDLSNVTSISRMFYQCIALTSLPALNTSNVTNMESAFTGTSITSIPQLDTSNVTNINSAFYNCRSLQSLPELDLSKVTYAISAFEKCDSLVNVGGFKNLKCEFSLRYTNKLSNESIINIFNSIYNWTTNPDGEDEVEYVKKITFSTTLLARIPDDIKVIATDKGWTLAT